jgi:hypothetical protein
MALAIPARHHPTARRLRSVPWPAVAGASVLMAAADTFVLVSVQGAVGAIERAQSPFSSWLVTSALLLPLYVGAVLLALATARRRLPSTLRPGRRTVATALLVAVAGTLVAFGAVVAGGVQDYRLQAALLTRTGALHSEHLGADAGSCDSVCQHLAETRQADLRAARYATATDLGVNVAAVAWVVALCGGRLDRPVRRRAGTPVPPG